MALFDTTWYCNFGNGTSTGYYAVAAWATGATIAAGALRRQLAAPAVGSERVFICIVAGTTGGSEPSWVLTRGAKTTDNTVTWQECTGASAVNGDVTNTPSWSGVTGGIATAITLGAIIKRNNAASYWICSTAGTTGTTEPAWANNTAGTTQTDGTVTWTCLGVVGSFTGGQAPHARLANACATNWFAAGNTVYVGDNHAESQTTTININPAGGGVTSNVVGRILCHNHSSAYPPAASDLTTGATVSTTINVGINFFSNAGSFYVYGLTLKVAVGSTGGAALTIGASQNTIYLDNCSLWLASTTGTGLIQFTSGGSANSFVILNNTTFKFAAIGQSIGIYNVGLVWQNTAPALVSGSTIPNTLISTLANVAFSVILEALDLSAYTGALFFVSTTTTAIGTALIKDCKLNSSATIANPPSTGTNVQVVRSDSGATAYKSALYTFEGTETTETAVTRTGGAVDPTGQAQSRKIATTANSQWLFPFKAESYAIWNPTTAANVTVTVYGIVNDTTVPNNDDAWIEAEYLGSASAPLGTITNTTKSNVLAANAAGAADTSAWDGAATARANTASYTSGTSVIKLASNPGRVFFCTTSGTSAGSEPGGYATAVDGGSVTDGTAVFRAGCRFKLTKTLSSPQPGLPGYIAARVRAAKPSMTYYLDPKIVLS